MTNFAIKNKRKNMSNKKSWLGTGMAQTKLIFVGRSGTIGD